MDAYVIGVVEGRYRDVHPFRATLGRLGLRPFYSLARVASLLGELRCSHLKGIGRTPGLRLPLPDFGVALLQRGHHSSGGDLPDQHQQTGLPQRLVVGSYEHVDYRQPRDSGLNGRLAEGQDRLGVRGRIRQPQAAEVLEGRPAPN